MTGIAESPIVADARLDPRSLQEHEASKLLPMMNDKELDELAADIRANGQQAPVALVRQDGAFVVLDGRNRIEACRRLNRIPKYVVLTVRDAVDFVYSANVSRRHLTDSQLAMVAARMATLRDGQRKAAAPPGAPSQDEAAEKVGVSRRSVQRARVVLNSGRSDLVDAVERGEMAVTEAARLVSPPRIVAQQHEEIRALGKLPKGRGVDHEARLDAVLKLHQNGNGTTEIARITGLDSSQVSAAKVRLGVAATVPSVKAWADISHIALTLEASTLQIDSVTAALQEETDIKATDEEIGICIKRLVRSARATHRLCKELKKRHKSQPQ